MMCLAVVRQMESLLFEVSVKVTWKMTSLPTIGPSSVVGLEDKTTVYFSVVDSVRFLFLLGESKDMAAEGLFGHIIRVTVTPPS